MTSLARLFYRSWSLQAFFSIFGSILHRFSMTFSLLFEVASCERVDVQRDGPNLCFCRQVRHFRGFARFAKTPENDEMR